MLENSSWCQNFWVTANDHEHGRRAENIVSLAFTLQHAKCKDDNREAQILGHSIIDSPPQMLHSHSSWVSKSKGPKSLDDRALKIGNTRQVSKVGSSNGHYPNKPTIGWQNCRQTLWKMLLSWLSCDELRPLRVFESRQTWHDISRQPSWPKRMQGDLLICKIPIIRPPKSYGWPYDLSTQLPTLQRCRDGQRLSKCFSSQMTLLCFVRTIQLMDCHGKVQSSNLQVSVEGTVRAVFQLSPVANGFHLQPSR